MYTLTTERSFYLIFYSTPCSVVCVRVHADLMHAGSTMRPLSSTVDKPSSCDRESTYTCFDNDPVIRL